MSESDDAPSVDRSTKKSLLGRHTFSQLLRSRRAEISSLSISASRSILFPRSAFVNDL